MHYLIFITLKELHTSLPVSLNCFVYIQKDPNYFRLQVYKQNYIYQILQMYAGKGG